jgi:hypothetical protein
LVGARLAWPFFALNLKLVSMLARRFSRRHASSQIARPALAGIIAPTR